MAARFRTTAADLARVIYTGGYLVPGTQPNQAAGGLFQRELERSTTAVEASGLWFQTRDAVGVVEGMGQEANYETVRGFPEMLQSVREVAGVIEARALWRRVGTP